MLEISTILIRESQVSSGAYSPDTIDGDFIITAQCFYNHYVDASRTVLKNLQNNNQTHGGIW